MLGHFRFLLALLVIVYHFGTRPFCRQWGVYAVFGFYVDLRLLDDAWCLHHELRLQPRRRRCAISPIARLRLFPPLPVRRRACLVASGGAGARG